MPAELREVILSEF